MIPALLAIILSASALEADIPPPVLAEQATAIVIGEVAGAQSYWAPDTEGYIQTEVSWAVEKVVQGEVPSSLMLLLEGGQIGEYRTGHSDQPELLEDHRYLLLLRVDEAGRWRPFSVNGTVELRSEKSPRAPLAVDVLRAFGVQDVD